MISARLRHHSLTTHNGASGKLPDAAGWQPALPRVLFRSELGDKGSLWLR
jgi:hypothetical protein